MCSCRSNLVPLPVARTSSSPSCSRSSTTRKVLRKSLPVRASLLRTSASVCSRVARSALLKPRQQGSRVDARGGQVLGAGPDAVDHLLPGLLGVLQTDPVGQHHRMLAQQLHAARVDPVGHHQAAHLSRPGRGRGSRRPCARLQSSAHRVAAAAGRPPAGAGSGAPGGWWYAERRRPSRRRGLGRPGCGLFMNASRDSHSTQTAYYAGMGCNRRAGRSGGDADCRRVWLTPAFIRRWQRPRPAGGAGWPVVLLVDPARLRAVLHDPAARRLLADPPGWPGCGWGRPPVTGRCGAPGPVAAGAAPDGAATGVVGEPGSLPGAGRHAFPPAAAPRGAGVIRRHRRR